MICHNTDGATSVDSGERVRSAGRAIATNVARRTPPDCRRRRFFECSGWLLSAKTVPEPKPYCCSLRSRGLHELDPRRWNLQACDTRFDRCSKTGRATGLIAKKGPRRLRCAGIDRAAPQFPTASRVGGVGFASRASSARWAYSVSVDGVGLR